MSYNRGEISTNDLSDLQKFILDEFNKIEQSFNLFDAVRLKNTTISPLRPRDGMVVYASADSDANEWEPVEGGGAGFYGYYGGSWHKLG
jgi:hypothetical protein